MVKLEALTATVEVADLQGKVAEPAATPLIGPAVAEPADTLAEAAILQKAAVAEVHRAAMLIPLRTVPVRVAVLVFRVKVLREQGTGIRGRAALQTGAAEAAVTAAAAAIMVILDKIHGQVPVV